MVSDSYAPLIRVAVLVAWDFTKPCCARSQHAWSVAATPCSATKDSTAASHASSTRCTAHKASAN